MNIESSILSTQGLQDKLSEIFPNATKVVIISAYITEKALVWIYSLIPKECEVTLVSRLAVSDLNRGSSDLKSVDFALSKNWNMCRLPELHAKIYLTNDLDLFVGSSNCTSNGLRLYGEGNLESSVQLKATENELEFIKNIINKASLINFETLDKMKKHLSDGIDANKDNHNDWPDEIFEPTNDLWVSDLPWNSPSKLLSDSHDLELLKINSNDSWDDISTAYIKTKAFKWIYGALKSTKEHELYYGELTALLHDNLCDDPSPYRRSIKDLLSNLLEYCRTYAPHLIDVDRPRHSQRIFLKKENSDS